MKVPGIRDEFRRKKFAEIVGDSSPDDASFIAFLEYTPLMPEKILKVFPVNIHTRFNLTSSVFPSARRRARYRNIFLPKA